MWKRETIVYIVETFWNIVKHLTESVLLQAMSGLGPL